MGKSGKIPFLGPKKGLSGGASSSHLKNPLGIFNSTFNRDLQGEEELNIPRGFFKWLQEAPPESPFLGPKNGIFPDFPIRGSVGGRPVRNFVVLVGVFALVTSLVLAFCASGGGGGPVVGGVFGPLGTTVPWGVSPKGQGGPWAPPPCS